MNNVPTTLRNGISRPMKKFDDMFSRFFDGFNNDFPLDLFDTQFFYGDIYTSDDNSLCIDVPGFNKENLNVEYRSGTISITGENDFGRKIHKKIKLYKDLGEPQTAEVKDGVLKLEFETSQIEDSKKIELE